MTFVNTTPHPVHVLDQDGKIVLTVPPATQPLRLGEVTEPIGQVDGVQIVRKTLGGAAQLPPPKAGVYYVVSLPVAQAVRRADFVVPDDLVRDDQGRVVGCRRFAVIV